MFADSSKREASRPLVNGRCTASFGEILAIPRTLTWLNWASVPDSQKRHAGLARYCPIHFHPGLVCDLLGGVECFGDVRSGTVIHLVVSKNTNARKRLAVRFGTARLCAPFMNE